MAVLLLCYVVVEVVAVGAVGAALGFLPTVGLLLAGAILGSWLARREGGRAFRAFMATAGSGKPAHTEITDGLLVALGGVLIMLPGFVSDVAGLLLLLPSRGLVRKAWLRKAERDAQRHGVNTRTPMGGPAFGQPSFGQQSFGQRSPGQRRETIVVDSEVVDTDDRNNPSASNDGNNPSAGNGGNGKFGPSQPGFGMSK